jgi:drug/metabolite transporter (DMT)-like permease
LPCAAEIAKGSAMENPQQKSQSGLLFALAGFALLTCGDAVIKTLADEWPGTAVAALRYTLGAMGLAGLLFVQQGRAGFALPNPKMQLLRGASVAIATVLFFSSIFLMPLTEATAIGFTSPMLTAIFGAIMLREPAGRTTWAASIIAFIGVLIILRPNVLALGLVGLMPLGAAACMALTMIGNRAVAQAGSPLLMQFLIAAIAVPVLVITAMIGHGSGLDALVVPMPDWTIILRIALVAISASTAHWMIYMGTMRASAADVAPMTYVQMLTTMIFGALFFGDFPDWTSIAGGGIIILSGIWLWSAQGRAPAR